MLKRNYYAKRKKVQELLNSSLLSIGDFNVRVTVVDKSNLTSEGAWKEVFRDSIGGGIINDSTNQYYLEILNGSGKCVQTTDVGNEILNNNFDYIKDEDMVRISLVKLPTENKYSKLKTWIIIRM